MTPAPKSTRPLIVPVLLSGGTGTRLWPLSREAYPKQFLPMHGEHTLLQQAALRTASQARFGRTLVIANNDHRFIVAEQLRALDLAATIVIEPVGRNTAPAAAVAALHAQETDPDALLLLTPADHVIERPDVLMQAVEAGAATAQAGRIVLFGVEPTRPATGYGYIQIGDPLSPGVATIAAFVEKPDQATASRYAACDDYLWNSGIFLVRARHLLAELERFEPGVVTAARAALVDGDRDLEFLRLEAATFAQSPSISLDHAVLERTDKAAVVRVSCAWTDLGAWSALWDIGERDGDGNVLTGDAVAELSKGCYLRGEGPLVAAVGVENLIVVATDDVVLVAHKDYDEDVKRLVERLKREGCSAAITSRRCIGPGDLRVGSRRPPFPGEAHHRCALAPSSRSRSISTAPSTGSW